MKKCLLYLLPLLAGVGCSRDQISDGGTSGTDLPVFEATVEEQPFTKAGIDPSATLKKDLLVLWKAEDRLSVFPKNEANIAYCLNSEADNRTGTFIAQRGNVSLGQEIKLNGAIYPYSENHAVRTADEEGIDFDMALPAEQQYFPDTFDPKAYLMTAVSQGLSLNFKNVCNVLKIQLTGTECIRKIILRGNNDELLSGEGICSHKLNGAPIWKATAGISGIILNCGAGVQLNMEAPTAFYIVLPPVTFKKGISIFITDTEGRIMKKSLSDRLSCERNSITEMNVFQYADNTNEKTEMLSGKSINEELLHLNSNIEGGITRITFEHNSSRLPDTSSILISKNIGLSDAYAAIDPEHPSEVIIFTSAEKFVLDQNCSEMFKGLDKMKNIENLDQCSADEVTAMNSMFQYCSSLESLDLSSFNTPKLTSTEGMFSHCSSFKNLDLRNFNTSRVYNATHMFEYCKNISQIKGFEDLDFSSVTNVYKMFAGIEDENLTIDFSEADQLLEAENMFDEARIKSLTVTMNLSHMKTMNRFFYRICAEDIYFHHIGSAEDLIDIGSMLYYAAGLTPDRGFNFTMDPVFKCKYIKTMYSFMDFTHFNEVYVKLDFSENRTKVDLSSALAFAIGKNLHINECKGLDMDNIKCTGFWIATDIDKLYISGKGQQDKLCGHCLAVPGPGLGVPYEKSQFVWVK